MMSVWTDERKEIATWLSGYLNMVKTWVDKILDNEHKDQISFKNDIDFLDETTQDICHSGLKLDMGLNKHEVIVVPKKHIKQGFFEKLFHLFK